MTGTSHESAKDLEKLFKIIKNVKFAMLTTINENGTLHSRQGEMSEWEISMRFC